MIYFALTVLALDTFGTFCKAIGIKFENEESSSFVKFVAGTLKVTAYCYIFSHFITLK
jgi:hypothetical protein